MRWLIATVAETVPQTVAAVTLALDIPDWPGHRAGQHVDVRLTAEDGYSAQRSYSIASPPGAARVELTIVRLDDGEVSPYLTTVVEAADELELRGPIGGYFVWEPVQTRPVLLVGGGSGVVPLVAMLRHHAVVHHQAPMHLVYSARTQAEILYRDELDELDDGHGAVTITLTREPASGWLGRRGRVDPDVLAASGWSPSDEPHCYVCGPTPSSRPSPTPSSPSATTRPTSRPSGSDQPEADMTDALDGNAAAGALAEIFIAEMTVARATCASCGDTRPIGELRAYLRAPGIVLRCRTCGAAEVRIVRAEARVWLDLRGVRVLQLEAPTTER